MPDVTTQCTRLSRCVIHLSLTMAAFSFCGVTSAQVITARVLSVTQETFATVTRPEICWQKIVTAHEKALNEEQKTPWLVKYWQPLLGAAMGGAIGYQFTLNYGPSSQQWKWPTVAGGAVVGAVAGPGATAGSYGLGTLAHIIWPTSLPLTVGFSLGGAVLGKILWDIVFPPNKNLQAPVPGQFMPNQDFFLETTCTKPERIEYRQAPYLITYMHQGKKQTSRVKYYPGSRVELTAAGRPVYEVTGAK
jgi:uncharacterized protein YcfJ